MHGASAKPDAAGREAVEAIERLLAERRLGRQAGPEGCDPLTWELLVLWEQRRYQHETLATGRIHGLNADDPAEPGGECDPCVFVDGECRGCGAKWGGGGVEQTVTITVDGRKRVVPAPPLGWVYDGKGELVCLNPGEGRPIGDTGLRTQPSPRIIGGVPPESCGHKVLVPNPGGGMRCARCGQEGY